LVREGNAVVETVGWRMPQPLPAERRIDAAVTLLSRQDKILPQQVQQLTKRLD
jgi:hypothetical protein